MAPADLPDVNVWIALSIPQHPFHARAEHYWRQEAAERIVLSTVTVLGMARICSSTAFFAEGPLDPLDAWTTARHWLSLSQVVYMYEPEGCVRTLDGLVAAGLVTRRTWTDAYLAAFAMAAGLRLVSFDTGFQRYPGLELLHLAP